ncbi:MAG: hypothetical protein JXR31_14735 [Prolixibacteraceae bacterium]|nr:hypothetical protein [Prolixibacteraceae bacterium]MBN2775509.1 hypothetical protein [Prolixibacteraceae bacterium]
MGKITRLILSICILTYLGGSKAYAQANKSESHNISIEIPEVALLDLETNSSSSISLSPVSPNEAGNSLDFSNAFNSQIWVNYSSIVGSSIPDRKVSAFVEGAIPDGVKLSVSASSYSGNGGGKLGTPVGKVFLSEQIQDVITNIGSCYTGDGVNNGHLLTYSLELENEESGYASLNFDNSTTISITYTLSDNN